MPLSPWSAIFTKGLKSMPGKKKSALAWSKAAVKFSDVNLIFKEYHFISGTA